VHGLKILLVDDDVGSLKGMQLALTMMKHACDAYSDPVEALASYTAHPYDFVITDICMPTLNGFELAKQIRNLDSNAKIIYISGYPMESMDKEIVDAEIQYLKKPVDFCQLKQMLDDISTEMRTISRN